MSVGFSEQTPLKEIQIFKKSIFINYNSKTKYFYWSILVRVYLFNGLKRIKYIYLSIKIPYF